VVTDRASGGLIARPVSIRRDPWVAKGAFGYRCRFGFDTNARRQRAAPLRPPTTSAADRWRRPSAAIRPGLADADGHDIYPVDVARLAFQVGLDAADECGDLFSPQLAGDVDARDNPYFARADERDQRDDRDDSRRA
jgi:hypothetical protein